MYRIIKRSIDDDEIYNVNIETINDLVNHLNDMVDFTNHELLAVIKL